jgi:predicted lipoprotein with Yx(FWY)xxD motif
MRTIAMLAACGLVLAGCGSDSGAGSAPESSPTASSSAQPSPDATTPPGGTPTSPANTSAPPGAGTGIKTAASDFGPMLFDTTGQAIYLFDKETSSAPACYSACAVAWPPVLTDGPPTAAGEVKQSLLGTTKRTDGKTQVTYGGHPLYYYAHEGKNEVKCHNITGFGGLWLVVTPSGDAAPA